MEILRLVMIDVSALLHTDRENGSENYIEHKRLGKQSHKITWRQIEGNIKKRDSSRQVIAFVKCLIINIRSNHSTTKKSTV